MNAIHITKSQIIDELVDYEINWFDELDPDAKVECLKDIFTNGTKGFKSCSDRELLDKCVDIGMFLMEE